MNNLTIVQDKEWIEELSRELPPTCSMDKMKQLIWTEFERIPLLKKCSRASVKKAFLTVLQLGLEGVGDKFYFIPYKVTGTHDQYECSLIVSYKGKCELIWRTGRIKTLDSDVVCENDIKFSIRKGSSVCLEHEPATQNRGKVIGAYAYVLFKDDGLKYDYLPLDEIHKIAYRPGQDGKFYPRSHFWRDHFNEMAKKTALHRLFKTLPDIPELTLVNEMEYAAQHRSEPVSEVLPHHEISHETD